MRKVPAPRLVPATGTAVHTTAAPSPPVNARHSPPTAPVAAPAGPYSGPYSGTASIVPEIMDRATHAWIAKFTFGLSPASLTGAYLDWLTHLGAAPGKRLDLAEKLLRKWARLSHFALRCLFPEDGSRPCIEPLPQDQRFRHPDWQRWPFNLYYQSHLLAQQWWHEATTGVPGVSAQHERMVAFTARQILDIIAPSNALLTNPELIRATIESGGLNFLRGFNNFIEDCERAASGRTLAGAEAFRPGTGVALTPGKVVYANSLMELIQYSPASESVHPEPVLVVPAWIMKYYILDLSPGNSLIRHLVEQGFTVFAISWRNPDATGRDLGLDDYRRLGVIAALEAISTILPGCKVHGAGYCLGGTLLAIAAAALERNGGSIFASLSFLAAQIDFTEPGELQLFIDESQLRFLEDMMWEQGYLEARQMSGAFQMLRSNDLVWSRVMREYLMGERPAMTDLMAWNADSTRMPYRMHAEYLRKLYLGNDLAEGRFNVDGKPVTITDIRAPVFAVGTRSDHVAPWRSVYKWNNLTDTGVTFVLTTGGHNAGIVSEPGHHDRSYQIGARSDRDFYIDPDTWAATTPVVEGSWWPAWTHWLAKASGARVAPPGMGAPEKGLPPLSDAPGRYVMES